MAEGTALYLWLGTVASILLAFGLLLMKSRGPALAPAQTDGFFRAIGSWVRDPVWLAGLGIQIAGYALYLVAVSGAPVSLLAVMMQGGIAIFVVLAVIFLHERANWLEWLGIIGIVGSMLLLVFSPETPTDLSPASGRRLIVLSIIVFAIACPPYFSQKMRSRGLAAALASGLGFGLGSLYPKAITLALGVGGSHSIIVPLLLSPWLYLTIATNLAGLILLQNSFHDARGIVAMPLSSALSNLVPIVGGIFAFGEALPLETGAAAMRLAAFALTIVSSGFLATAAALGGTEWSRASESASRVTNETRLLTPRQSVR